MIGTPVGFSAAIILTSGRIQAFVILGPMSPALESNSISASAPAAAWAFGAWLCALRPCHQGLAS